MEQSKAFTRNSSLDGNDLIASFELIFTGTQLQIVDQH